MFSMQKHVHVCLAHCSINRNFVMFILFVLFSTCTPSSGIGDVIWAVNSGGEAHTDVHGIRYKADKLDVGIESDYGKTLSIGRVVHQDQILYQTERYHMSNFGYEIPIKEDGDYVLVLKFCEVWFTSPNKKVFDVVLNRDITVVDSLDIFTKVGRGVAHDEIVPFSIVNGNLKVNDEISRMEGKLLVEFVKGEYDNPKINAIYVMKGTVDDVPKLPAIPGSESQKDEEEEEEEEANESKSSKVRRPSGPKVLDPYSADDTSTILLPVFVAVGAFVPLLFCLCKL